MIDAHRPGRPPKLTAQQKHEIEQIVDAGPNPETDGVVRWRCADIRALIQDRYGVDLNERSVSRLLKELGFAHVSARPQHPRQAPAAAEVFNKTRPA